ncbi:tetratricopeptide repeat protein [Aromatoleum toluolicum]|uniref:Tetratricopeptide repeat protein n=1 Tax=Aromatoleum toluolicum TaxID=90060 RepID=A0ABX1NBR5_9RHOO|nr:hypothetical protein [Aromatoleum toluolicum]NMF96735.1 tetratricopeptide repeat protein [Aromatoleum toluolicum]
MKTEPDVGWEHTHHWCDCVRLRYRAIKALGDKATFSHNLNEAIGGCDYVIRAAKPGFRMLPKVHVDRGRALKLRGDTGAAVLAFQRAISLDPMEISAYSELSLIQEEQGQEGEARETVTRGLQHNPDSQMLQKRYLELGGKEPFPEPIARIAPLPAPADRPTEAPPSDTLELELQDPVLAVEAPVEPTVQNDGLSTEAGKPADVGSGRSCRFCPPEEIQRRWIESFKTNQEKKPE